MTKFTQLRTASAGIALLSAGLLSGTAMADQVILDDLIVDGSACIGFDCVNGESFGFDTLRLKENNLRVHFEDTSNSASFPTNDWRIIINDSSNGGANYFGVEDSSAGRIPFRIEAGAPNHSLYVDDGGRLGLGTSTPVTDIHIKSGNTPTLRLEQDGTSGFTPQTWDVAGNEANFFVRDATNGSTLPFRIFPSAPSQSLVIEGTTGHIGLGTTSPAALLHLQRGGGGADGLPRIRLENTDIAADTLWDVDVSDTDIFRISVNGSGDQELQIDNTGNLTVLGNVECLGTSPCFTETSDLRLKAGVRTLTGAGAIVSELRPILWNNKDGTTATGLGAQEVAAVMARYGLPNWSGHVYDKAQDRHGLGYTAFIGLLVSAHQDKDAKIADLESRLAKVEAALAALIVE